MIGYAVVLAILTSGLVAVVVAAHTTSDSEPPPPTAPHGSQEPLDVTMSSVPETSRPSSQTRSADLIRESEDTITGHVSRGP